MNSNYLKNILLLFLKIIYYCCCYFLVLSCTKLILNIKNDTNITHGTFISVIKINLTLSDMATSPI